MDTGPLGFFLVLPPPAAGSPHCVRESSLYWGSRTSQRGQRPPKRGKEETQRQLPLFCMCQVPAAAELDTGSAHWQDKCVQGPRPGCWGSAQALSAEVVDHGQLELLSWPPEVVVGGDKVWLESRVKGWTVLFLCISGALPSLGGSPWNLLGPDGAGVGLAGCLAVAGSSRLEEPYPGCPEGQILLHTLIPDLQQEATGRQ